jgi:hypothetical protein
MTALKVLCVLAAREKSEYEADPHCDSHRLHWLGADRACQIVVLLLSYLFGLVGGVPYLPARRGSHLGYTCRRRILRTVSLRGLITKLIVTHRLFSLLRRSSDGLTG